MFVSPIIISLFNSSRRTCCSDCAKLRPKIVLLQRTFGSFLSTATGKMTWSSLDLMQQQKSLDSCRFVPPSTAEQVPNLTEFRSLLIHC
jgi:hypothetical protein